MKRLLLLCLLLPCAALARPPPEPSALPAISLLTFAPGDIYWQRFGHNALLVRDAAGERVYNYGIFDFRQKDFLLNFARGVMRYRLEAEPLWATLLQYRREGRWVREQRLRLLPTQALALRDFLHENALPQNAEYRYDYFLSNCSTKVRDALDQALDGALRQQLEARVTTSTYRSEATRLMSPDFWWFVGMDLVVAAPGDVPINEWQKAFSPLALMAALREVRTGGVPLVAEERVLVDMARADPPAEPPSLIWLAGVGLLFGALLWRLSRSSHRSARAGFAVLAFALNLAAGVGGLILLGIWTLTEHWSWHANHNLLLFNPLCLLLLPAAFLKAPGRLTRISAGAVALGVVVALLLPGQANLVWCLLWAPIHAAMAGAIVRPLRASADDPSARVR